MKRNYNTILTEFSDTSTVNYVARAVLAFLNKTLEQSSETFASSINSSLTFLKSYVILEENSLNENLAILSNGFYIQGALNVKSINNKFFDNSVRIVL